MKAISHIDMTWESLDKVNGLIFNAVIMNLFLLPILDC